MPTPRFRKLAAARLAVSEPISPAVSSLFDGEGGATALSTRSVPVARLAPLPGQPARPFDPSTLSSLSQSIAEHGVLEPLLVRPVGSGGYQIIAGERRWRAAILAGLEKVPAVVREMDDLTALQTAIGESLGQRVAATSATAFVETRPSIEASIATPVVNMPIVNTPIVDTPIAHIPIVNTPIVNTPIVNTPIVAEPVIAAPIVAPSPLELPAAPLAETDEALDLLDRIGELWLRARELAGAIEEERAELSSYDRERARKTLLSIRIAADNGATLLRD
jgi:hypothetical protein